MRNMITIFKREFAVYFNSPIGYIFMMIFVFLNVFLYMRSFLMATVPRASVRGMFEFMPFILCVFVPLITMRLWAEDRKENTIEMLLTFPMKPHQLVLGKYFASLAFFVLSLVGTLTVPIMLGVLGKPDWGVIISSYLGAFFLGALFLALGIFVSGLVKDQIVAAVISIAICFGLYLIGMDYFAAELNDYFDGLGNFLQKLMGVTSHYQAFVRGIIEFADLLYFGVWVAIFLFLNGMYLEGRNRKGYQATFAASVLISLMIGILFNSVFGTMSLGRFDATENQIHTVSDASKRILSDLKAPVQVNYYVSPKEDLPDELKNLSSDVIDKLEEMKVASSQFKYKVVYLKTATWAASEAEQDTKKKREKSLEESLDEKGVKPFTLVVSKGDKRITQLLYSSIGIVYKAKKEEIIERIMPGQLQNLEYQLVSKAFRLARAKKPIVALMAPRQTIPEYMRRLYQQMGRPLPPQRDPYQKLQQLIEKEGGYQVKRINFDKSQPLPKDGDFDVLVVINPKDFNERQRWEIARALHNGKKVFLAVQNYSYNYNIEQRKLVINQNKENPNVNQWLKEYGVVVDEEVLMDPNSIPLAMGLLPISFPTHIIAINENMNNKVAITRQLEQIPYIWGTALKIDSKQLEESGLKLTKIMNSSNSSWKLPKGRTISYDDREAPLEGLNQYPLMVLLEGQFLDIYAGKERPKWPKPKQQRPGFPPPGGNDGKDNAPVRIAKPNPGKLVLLGSSQPFREEFIEGSGIALMLNVLDAVALDEDLATIRSKQVSQRYISKPSDGQRTFWKWLNRLLIPLLLLLLGFARIMLRRIQREQYLINQNLS